MQLLFVFFGLLVGAQAIPVFIGNISSNSADFSYRETKTWSINPVLLNIYGTSAVAVDLKLGAKTATSDGVVSFTVTGTGIPPTTLLAYYEAGLQVAVDFGNIANPLTFNFSASAGMAATSFLKLEEVNSDGAVVQTVSLSGDLLGHFWTFDKMENGANGLKSGIYKFAKLISDGFSVKLTIVTSDVTGILDFPGSPIIVPKAVESLIEITGFPYVSSANQVRLVIAAASAKGSVSGDGSFSFGQGAGQTFFHASNKAETNGALTDAKVSATTSGTFDGVLGNGAIEGIVKGKYQAEAKAQIFTVTFAAGAASIKYDPSLGSGTNPNTSSSGLMIPSFLVLMVALLKVFAF